MRVLVASASYPTPLHPKFLGGAETFAVQLCEALVERGHKVCVVRSGPTWGVWDRETVSGVDVITLPTRNLYSPWQKRSSSPFVRAAWHFVEDRSFASSGIDRVFRDFVPDVLHTNSLYGLTTGMWSKARLRRIPVVHTLHDYYLICARSTRFKSGVRCLSTCVACSFLTKGRRRAATFVDTVVSVSERTLVIHQEGGLFRSGVNRTVIVNPPPRVKKTVMQVRPKAHVAVFGFIGRPSVEKGIFELLSSFQKIPKGLARLLVAGSVDAELRTRLLECIGDSDVELLGFVTPEKFFEQIDVMVIPSIWEDPCPMVIGESFAYARPVIGARRGGIPELVGSDKTGWLYEPATGELEKLLLAIATDRLAIAVKSRYLLNRAKPRDFDTLVTEYVSAYREAIKSRDAGLKRTS